VNLGGGGMSKTQHSLSDQQDLARRKSCVMICGFKWRCRGELCDYRRSPRTATAQSPECRKRQATSQDGRAINPLRHSRGVVLEKHCGSASPGKSVVQGYARQETEQKTSAMPPDITGSHVTITARSSLGTAAASRTSIIKVKPGGTFVCARL